MNTPHTQCTFHRVLKATRLHRPWLATVIASLVVGTMGFASDTGAAQSPTLEGAGSISDTASQSSDFAGYQVTPSVGLTSAQAEFTVPTITCTKRDTAEGADMFEGVQSNTMTALIDSRCLTTGGVQYLFDIGTGGDSQEYPGHVEAGDTVVATVVQFPPNINKFPNCKAVLHDLRGTKRYRSRLSYPCPTDTSVNIGSFNTISQNAQPVPTFAGLRFSHVTVNGDSLGSSNFEPVQYDEVFGSNVLIKSSLLHSTSTGTGFGLVFKNAT